MSTTALRPKTTEIATIDVRLKENTSYFSEIFARFTKIIARIGALFAEYFYASKGSVQEVIGEGCVLDPKVPPASPDASESLTATQELVASKPLEIAPNIEETKSVLMLRQFERLQQRLQSSAESLAKTARAHPHVAAAVIAAGVFGLSMVIPALLDKWSEKMVPGDLAEAFQENENHGDAFNERIAQVKHEEVVNTLVTLREFRLAGREQASVPEFEVVGNGKPLVSALDRALADQAFLQRAPLVAKEPMTQSVAVRPSCRPKAWDLIVPLDQIRSLPEAFPLPLSNLRYSGYFPYQSIEIKR